MVVDIEHKGVGLTFRAVGNPIGTTDAGETRYESPPLLGEHTTKVLKEIAGYGEDEIELLLRDGIVATKNKDVDTKGTKITKKDRSKLLRYQQIRNKILPQNIAYPGYLNGD